MAKEKQELKEVIRVRKLAALGLSRSTYLLNPSGERLPLTTDVSSATEAASRRELIEVIPTEDGPRVKIATASANRLGWTDPETRLDVVARRGEVHSAWGIGATLFKVDVVDRTPKQIASALKRR